MQTLHQRHKSTGTLASMLPIGGLKAAAKRTAFGDVSNIAKNLTVRDDSALAVKSVLQDILKPTLAHPEKSAAFLRPAQRPLNPAGPKATLSNPSSNIASDHAPVAIAPETKVSVADLLVLQPQPQVSKKMLQRRATTIFKDEGVKLDVSVVNSVVPVVKEESIPTAPVHQKLGPRHHKSQPHLNPEPPVLRRTQSRYIETKAAPNITAVVEISKHDEEDREETSQSHDEAYELYVDALSEREQEPGQEIYEPREIPTSGGILEEVQHRQSGLTQLVSEPEEYWEEEEEEIYDDQGYTTAHSTRSRGDNTTGGATTVLFPKVTNKAKRELAEAKVIVESSRTMDEIEDEAWDTSMVAEYGDEIFAYMRELEVSMHFPTIIWFATTRTSWLGLL